MQRLVFIGNTEGKRSRDCSQARWTDQLKNMNFFPEYEILRSEMRNGSQSKAKMLIRSKDNHDGYDQDEEII